jgi:hypothetical protein
MSVGRCGDQAVGDAQRTTGSAVLISPLASLNCGFGTRRKVAETGHEAHNPRLVSVMGAAVDLRHHNVGNTELVPLGIELQDQRNSRRAPAQVIDDWVSVQQIQGQGFNQSPSFLSRWRESACRKLCTQAAESSHSG